MVASFYCFYHSSAIVIIVNFVLVVSRDFLIIPAVMVHVVRSFLFCILTSYIVAIVCFQVGLCPVLPAGQQTGATRPSPELYSYNLTHQMSAARRRSITCLSRVSTTLSLLVVLLLLRAGVETNPGPSIKQGVLNARSIVNKGQLILDLISTHRLDTLAVCETWIVDDDLDVIKLDAVPQGYAILHVPRPSASSRNRGGGLCFIHRGSIAFKSHSLQCSLHYMTFESQLLTLTVSGSRSTPADVITFVVIYRPLSSSSTSLTSFLDELCDLLVQLGDVIDADRLVICGDFNCAGVNSTSIHADLTSLLVAHDLQQFRRQTNSDHGSCQQPP